MTTERITAQCKRCKWHGMPTFEEFSAGYIRIVCPKCHSFIKFIKKEDVPKKGVIIKRDLWWDKVKARESRLRPAYMIQRDLSKLQVDYAALQIENEQLKGIVQEATKIITEAMEREGIIEHVPAWMKE